MLGKIRYRERGMTTNKCFKQAIQVYKISALLSPNGQELIAQQPCLICLDCKEVLK